MIIYIEHSRTKPYLLLLGRIASRLFHTDDKQYNDYIFSCFVKAALATILTKTIMFWKLVNSFKMMK